MSHHICGLVIALPYDVEKARSYDLIAALTDGARTLFPIDHHWSAVWQRKRGDVDGRLDLPLDLPARFPIQGVIQAIAEEVTGCPEVRFGVILTDYFGGHGDQWGVLFEGRRRIGERTRVNEVLRALGLVSGMGNDEWDTFGLADVRKSPGYLDRYRALATTLELRDPS
jgi:hypothetical protein